MSLSSSAIACARFLSTLLCTLLLICHLRSRSICSLVLRGIFLPKASLPTLPIMVVRPLSCTEKDRGTPTLLLDSFSLWVNALHSGPLLIVEPVITRPQLPQIISPDSAECTMLLLPHSEQTSSFVSLSLLLDIFVHPDVWELFPSQKGDPMTRIFCSPGSTSSHPGPYI